MPIGYLFSGQGAQKVGMGHSLSEQSATARRLYERADAVLGWPLSRYCFEGPAETLTETRVCQPALFVMGMAIFEILRERGHTDQVGAVLGLSLGELTALTAAGAFDFETGLKVVAERGRLMQEACDRSKGAMAALIGGTEAQVADLCREAGVEMANLNCPGQIVISGAAESIARALELAKAAGHFRAIPLTVAGAYHSRLMAPAQQAFAAYLEGVTVAPPAWPVFSNVTGGRVTDPAEIKVRLVEQVVSPVRWESCMRSAAALGLTDFYECGPGGVLAGHAKRTEKSWKVTCLAEFADLPA